MDEIPKRRRGRPPKVKPVESTEVVPNVIAVIPAEVIAEMTKLMEAPVKPVEAISPDLSGEDRLYREVMFKSLTKDVGLSELEAKEITDRFGRFSKLAVAFREGLELPIKDEVAYAKLKRICLCR